MKSRISLLVVITLFTLSASSVYGAGYIKLAGIKGDSQAAGHEGWIEVESFSWGANSPTSELGCAAPDHIISFTMTPSPASESMMQACRSRTPIQGAAVDYYNQRHNLSGLSFASCESTKGVAGAVDSFSLNFTRCDDHPSAENNASLITAAGNPLPLAVQEVKLSGPTEGLIIVVLLDNQPADGLNFLREAAASKQKVSSLTVEARNKQQEYYKVTFEDVLISSYQTGGDGKSSFSLNFSKASNAVGFIWF